MSHTDHHQHTPAEPDHIDLWHTHTVAEKPQRAHGENINAPMVIAYGVIGFGLIAAATVATMVYFNWYKNRLEIAVQERPDLRPNALVSSVRGDYPSYRALIEQSLEQFGWENADKGVVRLPLARATDKVLAEYAAKNPAAKPAAEPPRPAR